jgi:hypothetical protein
MGTNDGDGFGGDEPCSVARIRRQRSKFERVSLRPRQNALIVCPERFQASMVARQTWIFSGRCCDMTEFSCVENSKATRPDKASIHRTAAENRVVAG